MKPLRSLVLQGKLLNEGKKKETMCQTKRLKYKRSLSNQVMCTKGNW